MLLTDEDIENLLTEEALCCCAEDAFVIGGKEVRDLYANIEKQNEIMKTAMMTSSMQAHGVYNSMNNNVLLKDVSLEECVGQIYTRIEKALEQCEELEKNHA